jgi:hypothetical protein
VFSRVFVSIILAFVTTLSFSQDVKVRGYFAADSIWLGKPVSYYLTVSYPQKNTVLFPDSSFSFAPFELQKKNFAATVTKAGISYDSVIYTLTTFEIDSLQLLQLPVFVVQEQDCTSIYAEADTLIFSKMVPSLPDSTQLEKIPLKTNTNYFQVSWLLNYPVLSVVIGVLVVLLLVTWLVFGKRIRKYFAIKKMTKNHHEFIAQFNTSVESISSGFSAKGTEATLLIWKKYIEQLNNKPYTKYTTKEISELETDKRLVESLGAIDRMIYADRTDSNEHFINLKNFGEDQFNIKLEEIKNG